MILILLYRNYNNEWQWIILIMEQNFHLLKNFKIIKLVITTRIFNKY